MQRRGLHNLNDTVFVYLFFFCTLRIINFTKVPLFKKRAHRLKILSICNVSASTTFFSLRKRRFRSLIVRYIIYTVRLIIVSSQYDTTDNLATELLLYILKSNTSSVKIHLTPNQSRETKIHKYLLRHDQRSHETDHTPYPYEAPYKQFRPASVWSSRIVPSKSDNPAISLICTPERQSEKRKQYLRTTIRLASVVTLYEITKHT